MRLRTKLKRAFQNPSGLTLPQNGRIGPTDVTLCGRGSVEIVGCRALTAYEDCKISVSVKEGILTVHGEDLSLQTYCGARIAVCGCIRGIEFEEI